MRLLNNIQILDIILFVVLFPLSSYLSLVLHECGHYIGAVLMKAQSRKIIVNWREKQFFVKFNFGRKPTKREDIFISIAGPILQLIYLLILIFQPYLISLTLVALVYLPVIFLHFIPFEGSDGYYIQKRLSTQGKERYRKNTCILYLTSITITMISFMIILSFNPIFTLWTIVLLTLCAAPFWWKLLKQYFSQVIKV